MHVNDRNAEPVVHNPADPIGGYAGIPRNMTGVAELMRRGGYKTHFTGKWDAGMATHRHTPRGRGYDSFFGYFHHANDYWSEKIVFLATGTVDVCGNRFVDLWEDDAPAASFNGTAYEEELFTRRTLATIAAHDAADPLFLVHAFHITHTPLQVPKPWVDKFAFIDFEQRRMYAAMVAYMDGVVGQIADALKAREMWDSTLMLFTSDNGGAIYYPAGANNHPLKGGKYSDWEGGVRMNAFLAGGALPPAVRGTTTEALMHISDWYTTFAHLAGVNETDEAAAAAGLPRVDGVDLWPVISGVRKAARSEIQLSTTALVSGRMKLVRGKQEMTGWTGSSYPNATGQQPMFPHSPVDVWKHDCADGCLFNIFDDPNEHDDLSATQPHVLDSMGARLDELNRGHYEPDRGKGDPAACKAAEANGGFYGPWL